jgi:hypothetical protein
MVSVPSPVEYKIAEANEQNLNLLAADGWVALFPLGTEKILMHRMLLNVYDTKPSRVAYHSLTE